MEGIKTLSGTKKMKAKNFLEPKTYLIFIFGCPEIVLNLKKKNYHISTKSSPRQVVIWLL